ncbi:uncharacterized protein LOC130625541 isoform X2 [Hydractinia symbiolongicarpus]|uniref:uncharacterized protein LOC130625541 isoform X2 n=1 Tax=Hydractinia symbiolongicarpus TaxID=13093 RepID=UPI00254D9406|nr:uncharacterized protein LOC130625541 isoform X2 [Hydractinia symbiolongicarpus]
MSMAERMIPLKVVIIGASGVGKSCIMTKFCNGTLANGSTVGCDFRTKTMDHKGFKYRLQIWDTAGNERYWTLNTSYFRGADMMIIVYDVGKGSSFDLIDTFISQIKKYHKEDVPYAIVANKADLECWEVEENPKDATKGLFFLKTSCKTNLNINELFQRVVECCHDAKQEQIKQNGYDSGILSISECDTQRTSKENVVTFEGIIRNPCLTNVPYDLSISVCEALINCRKSGFLSMKNIFMYYRYFFVMREDMLYWFSNNKNATCIGQLDLNGCVSVTHTCQYITIKYYSEPGKSISSICLYAYNKQEFEEWLNLLQSQSRANENLKNEKNPDMIPLDIIGKLQFRNDEEINVTISKQSDEECVLQCIPKWFLGFLFDYSASFQFPLKSFRYYKDMKSSGEFLLTSTDVYMKLWFRPKYERLFVSKLKSIFGKNSFGGMVTTSVLNETFKMIYKIACLQLNVAAVSEVIYIIDEHIKDKEIHDLYLRGCPIIPQDIYAITHALSFYPGITSINLRNTHMTSKGLVYLLKALCKYESLLNLDFGFNEPIDSPETRSALQEYLPIASLESIKFMNTDVGNETFDVFFQALKTHETLTHVDIGFNSVDDVNSDAISQVIIHNTKLENLSMWHSHITEHGAMVLINALKQRSVNSPDLCLGLYGSQYISEETLKHLDECTRFNCKSEVEKEVKMAKTEGQSLPKTLSEFILEGDEMHQQNLKENEVVKVKLKEKNQNEEKIEQKRYVGLACGSDRAKSNIKNNYFSPLDDPEKMVAYVLDQKFIGERENGSYFSETLLDNYGKAKELWASCNRCDHPVLDVVAYYCNNKTHKNLLADVNTALKECRFFGLVIDEEEIHPVQEVEDSIDLPKFNEKKRQIFSIISNQIGFEARYLSHFLLDFDDVLTISVANEGNVTAYTSDVLARWYIKTKKELRTWKNLRSVLKFLGKGKLIEDIELDFKD